MNQKNTFSNFFFTKTAIIELKAPKGKAAITPPADGVFDLESVFIDGKKVLVWGSSNDLPNTYDGLINSNAVLLRSLSLRVSMLIGQGIVPVRVVGFNEDGSEKIELIDDTELISLLNRPWVSRYLAEAFRDVEKMGNAFVQFRPSMDGNSFVKISITNAKHVRLEYPDVDGISKNVLLNGMWPEGVKVNSYRLLSEHDAEDELLLLEDYSKPLFFQIKNRFSNNSYYAVPNWYAAQMQKWIEISNQTANLIKHQLDNYASSFLHIQIPRQFFEAKYPDLEPDEFRLKVQADVQKIETNLTTIENARAALTTLFDSEDQNTKWIIEEKKFSYTSENLQNNSAADTQIAIAAGVQPDILGLMFGNSKAGSMQREILLIMYALAFNDRNQVLEPLEMFIRLNSKWKDIELRFRNTFLTTLDSGKETSQTIA